jgi:hypothetical protein
MQQSQQTTQPHLMAQILLDLITSTSTNETGVINLFPFGLRESILGVFMQKKELDGIYY